MRTMAPWAPLMDFRKMDRLFDPFFEPPWYGRDAGIEWAPNVDVAETKDAVVVKAEMPGVEANDVHLTLADGVLTIKGEKDYGKEAKDERYLLVERAYGAFMRAIALPAAVEGEKVTAMFENGLLTVTLPKAPAATGTTIPIKTP